MSLLGLTIGLSTTSASAVAVSPELGLTDEGALGEDGANIGAGEETPGDGGDGIIDAPDLTDDGAVGEDGAADVPRDCVAEGGVLTTEVCFIPNAGPNAGAPEVRISDLVTFRPTKPAQSTQPNGWAVAGLPANFVAKAGAETLTGTLLGRPVAIRFTPAAWEWEYGDGEDRAAATGGASWTDLGVPEFSDTATSHVYRAKGTFTVTLTVRYEAEYQFAGRPWRTIAGTLPVEADPIVIVSATPKPVLVEDDCVANPAGPGC